MNLFLKVFFNIVVYSYLLNNMKKIKILKKIDFIFNDYDFNLSCRIHIDFVNFRFSSIKNTWITMDYAIYFK